VEYGDNGPIVTVNTSGNCSFVKWDDNDTSSPRQDTLVTENKTVKAIFSLMTPQTCEDSIEYEGREYDIRLVDNRCWFTENLDLGEKIDVGDFTLTELSIQGDEEEVQKFCYEDEENNCNDYGGLYQWNQAMRYQSNVNQGICPDGWRLPTQEDWQNLFRKVTNSSCNFPCNSAGSELKDKISWDGEKDEYSYFTPTGMLVQENTRWGFAGLTNEDLDSDMGIYWSATLSGAHPTYCFFKYNDNKGYCKAVSENFTVYHPNWISGKTYTFYPNLDKNHAAAVRCVMEILPE
jgi:uncharacterized protein (TIGR02145 family)